MRALYLVALAGLLAGCSSVENIRKEPALSPVGNGLAPHVGPLPVTTGPQSSYGKKAYNGLWADGEQDFFRDPRAKAIGDVLTVKVLINDTAKLENTSERSRDSASSSSGALEGTWGKSFTGSGNYSGEIGANSRFKGDAEVDRKDTVELSVAAVVTQVLPNGNLIISGQQEVRVNYEVRVLSVAGIVRPQDITSRNTIEYDKIAEARVSYGGRGRMTEVQQPGWGQQLLDNVWPY
ncbi:flagellar basal body L-ring protein FlgH [Rhodobacteraceae bacterium RKSG542]|uniref:flagellar basal body L-ring protein FlgH n=1 Tax=Pseudovibrio flavus TaxID=2529854 RepID=UPI0012BC7339|nr:flagellar basal body L-ring protein FlgH [Pseudovibrio flavus]MTI16927.1 flagellar basal body L-ring protein FlgH [Pseudovibrio flavus]